MRTTNQCRPRTISSVLAANNRARVNSNSEWVDQYSGARVDILPIRSFGRGPKTQIWSYQPAPVQDPYEQRGSAGKRRDR